jgi:enamine deaminase RidA (YjgF/YER057c/UK114 family)
MQQNAASWREGWGFIFGLGPVDLEDATTPLPESVEDQVQKIASNLDLILKQRKLTSRNVVAVRIHLIEFRTLHQRMLHAWSELFPNPTFTQSCVGVTALTRGAQVEMDFVVQASSSAS